VNPVAGSFAERVPVLVVSGGPSDDERRLGTLIHHQAKEIESQLRIYREVTCAAELLDDPRTASERVDAVVRTVWREQRPGYLEIHRDMVDHRVPVPSALLAWDGKLPFARSNDANAAEAVRDAAARLNAARRPVVSVGIETHRYKLRHEVRELAEKIGAPVVTTTLSKGAFPMDHPLYLGVHMGAISPEPIARRLARADLVLNLGGMRTDMDQGVGDPLPPERSVTAVDGRVDASFHSYRDVHIRDFVRGLLHVRLRNHRARVRYANNLPRDARPLTDRLRVADILRELNRFLAGRKNYAVVAESGDMLFGALDVKVDRGGGYFAQGFYASMGFGVPGALGAELGTGVRPIVLSGDGAFQMTGPELAQAPRYGLHPIVVVVNNGGWQIFRPVVKRPELLEVPPWPYAVLARAWGGAGIVARTVGEFRLALAAAARERRFVLIESMVAADDLSPVSRKYIQASEKQGKRRGR